MHRTALGHKPPNPSHYQFVGDSRTLADSFILLLAPYVAQTRENGGDFAPPTSTSLTQTATLFFKEKCFKRILPAIT